MKKPRKKKQKQPAKTPQAAPIVEKSAVVASGRAPASAVGDSGLEPMARSAAVPALLFAILGALLFWGDMHLVSQGGEMDARVHYPFESVKQVDSLHIKAAVDPRLTKGEAIYNVVGCNACHQPNGQGDLTKGCPPLAGSDWVLAKDPSRLAGIVLKGLSGPIVVSGKTYGTGVMTPFADTLSDEDIASVLSFIRNSWGNKAPLVESAEVKKIRAQYKDRGGYMDVPELMKIQLKE